MNKLMNLKRWIILSIYVLLSFVLPLLIYLFFNKYVSKDVIVSIPIIILLLTFITFNIYCGSICKLKFQNEKNPSKNKKMFEQTLLDMKSKRNYLLILMAFELIMIIIMGTVVYNTL